MKKLWIALVWLCFTEAIAQNQITENVVVVVLDGMRWQEIFGGVDTVLLDNPQFTRDKKRIVNLYGDPNPEISRTKLMPFMWTVVGKAGQLHGNRKYRNLVNVANPFQMTYPGFSEMLTGYVDPAISSNRLVTSKSSNVLEFLNSQQNYKDKVAVFATSDLFPYLMDRKQSKLYINADTDTLDLGNTESTLINSMQRMISKPTTEKPDILTYFSATEYIKHKKPKVLYLALGETDAFGHAGSYDQYLETAHTEDNFIKQLWEMLQAMPEYHDKTALLITCDHGRGGQVPAEWTSHGAKITDSGQIWLAALGPNIPSTGELRVDGQIYQAQIAATIAQILGYRYEPTGQGVYKPISGIVKAKN